MNKNYLAGAAIGLSLLFSFLAFTKPGQVVVHEVSKQLGGTSPDISSPYVNIGGISQWYGMTSSLNQASTTSCALQSPAATSTLVFASLHINVATTTASAVQFSRATTAFATTSPITTSQTSVGGGAEVNMTASTTQIFSPNTFLVISRSGGSISSTFSETGVCQAEWVQVSY